MSLLLALAAVLATLLLTLDVGLGWGASLGWVSNLYYSEVTDDEIGRLRAAFPGLKVYR